MLNKLSKDSNYLSIFEDLSHINGPFDIIGDVHGCFDELLELLKKLEYKVYKSGDTYKVSHLSKRKIVFVGDLVDRGPNIPEVLRIVMDMVELKMAYSVRGNHDDKLKRKLQGKNVKIIHGLSESLEQLALESDIFLEKVGEFLSGLKAYYILDNGKLIVSHAGLTANLIGKNSNASRSFLPLWWEH